MDAVQQAAERWRDLRPAIDVRPLLVVGRVQRLWALWDARLRATFAEAGLHVGDFDVLAALRRQDKPTAPSELAQAMLVTAGAATKRVDRLVAAGLAERVCGGADRRQRLVGLTPAGVRLVDELMTVHMRVQAQLLEVLTPGQCDELEGLLGRLLVSVDAPPTNSHSSL